MDFITPAVASTVGYLCVLCGQWLIYRQNTRIHSLVNSNYTEQKTINNILQAKLDTALAMNAALIAKDVIPGR